MATLPAGTAILAAMRAGVLALRRRLHVVIYALRPTRRWRFPVTIRRTQADSAHDPGILLEGYLVGELGAAARELFESWLAMDYDRELTVAALRHPYGGDADTPENAAPDPGDWWAACGQQLRAQESRPPGAPIDFPMPATELRIVRSAGALATRWYRPAAWAGLAATIVCAALGVWVIQPRRASSPSLTPVTEHSYATARGERAVITLDGATVVLGPESVLRISGTYGVHDRTVSLTGHGYFDVTHDMARPFRVWAGGVVAEDIGTRFDLRDYALDSAMRLVVADGAVAVHGPSGMPQAKAGHAALPQSVVVTRGMMASTDAHGVVRVRSGLATDRYLSWRDGRLEFDDTPLPEVVAELSRWYDLDIRLGDRQLASRTLTASFDDPPSAVLVALEGALGVRVVRSGRVVTLYPP